MPTIFDPISCKKCGNADQDKMRAEPSPNIAKRVEVHGRQIVTLKGWRCDECGHVTPEPKRDWGEASCGPDDGNTSA